MGSAPSIAAAQLMKGTRTVYGLDLDCRYIEVACQRYETLTGDTAKRIN
jgi:predicted RNA methylase